MRRAPSATAVPAPVALVIPNPHGCCEGHFPGNPVLPAVVLLDAVLCALEPVAGMRLTVAAAKFLNPVRPGQPLLLEHAPVQEGQNEGQQDDPDAGHSGACFAHAWRFTVIHARETPAARLPVARGLLRPAHEPDVLQEGR